MKITTETALALCETEWQTMLEGVNVAIRTVQGWKKPTFLRQLKHCQKVLRYTVKVAHQRAENVAVARRETQQIKALWKS